MKFQAQFFGGGFANAALRHPAERRFGTEMIKQIRAIPYWQERIDILDYIPNAGRGEELLTIDFSETDAAEIPCFADTSCVRVDVPKWSLTKYGSTPRPEERDGRVIVFYRPNVDTILHYWQLAGFPLEWNPDKPGEPFHIYRSPGTGWTWNFGYA